MGRLLITGSLAYDYILEYPGMLEDSLGKIHSEEPADIRFHSRKMKMFYGGCGGNVSYSLGLLNENPRLLANAGSGTQDYLAHLESVGVDCASVETIEGEQTATCLILNDHAQNRIVAFHGGVVDRASELDLMAAVDETIVGCIITPDDVPAMVKFAEQCRQLELPFYFDFGSQVTWLAPDQLRQSLVGAKAAFCNEYEFILFEKKTGWSIQKLLETVPVMLVTRGGDGCDLYLADNAEPNHIPACPLNTDSVDPSGAGDAFRAGFGFGRVHGCSWIVSAQLASTAAAFALEGQGTQGHSFDRDDLLQRCQNVYGGLPSNLLDAP